METETMNIEDTGLLADEVENIEQEGPEMVKPEETELYNMGLMDYYNALGILCLYMLRGERERLFNGNYDIVDILRNYPPHEFMAKIKEFQETMIMIGDIVDIETEEGPVTILVTKVKDNLVDDHKPFVYGFDNTGKTYSGKLIDKLGEHIDYWRGFVR